jgi:UDP-2-acetamido-3-amino-2,3-dideoxy-glucuronate N-acetyltransferase
MVGVPAKHIGWMSSTGVRLNLPLKGDAKVFCPESEGVYVLTNDFLCFEKR